MNEELKAKVVLIGDAEVGKTCIIENLKGNPFQHYSNTVSCGESIIEKKIEGVNIKFNFWDTAGQEMYQALTPQCIRNADITFLVFDLTKESTMVNLQYWLQIAQEENADNIIYMVGCKRDLAEEQNLRQVNYDTARRFIDTLKCDKKIKYCEVSAKTGQNLTTLLSSAAVDFLKNSSYSNKSEPAPNPVPIDVIPQKGICKK
ncbi:GTP binding [Tritrichomonas musculus]|uniref:GTP binding n=1 Tax=Tritrichomonas musculus TaxID=1915356 RepID=A0ABR2JTK2_9EUKA